MTLKTCAYCHCEFRGHGWYCSADCKRLDREREAERLRALRTCTSCGHEGDDVDERYSFGVYAGRLCVQCCSGYRDRCGLDGEQGDPRDLDEVYVGGWEAYDGE